MSFWLRVKQEVSEERQTWTGKWKGKWNCRNTVGARGIIKGIIGVSVSSLKVRLRKVLYFLNHTHSANLLWTWAVLFQDFVMKIVVCGKVVVVVWKWGFIMMKYRIYAVKKKKNNLDVQVPKLLGRKLGCWKNECIGQWQLDRIDDLKFHWYT